jgi:hypothetical protein
LQGDGVQVFARYLLRVWKKVVDFIEEIIAIPEGHLRVK